MKTQFYPFQQGAFALGLLQVLLWAGWPVAAQTMSDPNDYRSSLSRRMNRRVTHQVWQERIRALDEGPTPDQTELSDLIDQLNAVRIKPASSVSTPSQSTSTPPVTIKSASDQTLGPDPNVPIEPEPGEPVVEGPLTPSILKEIAQIKEANETLADPLTMAEMLYRHGYRFEARLFYEQTLQASDPNAPLDRAWILLQLGNCTKQSDLLAAQQYYSQVLQSYADSPWASMAQIQLELIQMMIDERPQELLEESRVTPALVATPSSNEGS